MPSHAGLCDGRSRVDGSLGDVALSVCRLGEAGQLPGLLLTHRLEQMPYGILEREVGLAALAVSNPPLVDQARQQRGVDGQRNDVHHLAVLAQNGCELFLYLDGVHSDLSLGGRTILLL